MPGLRSWIWRLWSTVAPYRPMAGGKQLLDREYADGVWDYLADLPELGRFSVLAGYCQALVERPNILEIGCGEGLLAEKLCTARIASYIGVDISQTAVDRARKKRIPNMTFVAADAAGFQPSATHNLILFTECLEYFDDPLALVQRYEPSLADRGFIIVSMFIGVDTNRSKRIWKMLSRSYSTFDETSVSNSRGLSWIIRVLRP